MSSSVPPLLPPRDASHCGRQASAVRFGDAMVAPRASFAINHGWRHVTTPRTVRQGARETSGCPCKENVMSNGFRCGAWLQIAATAVAALVAFAPASVSAQTPFIPYYGKNQIRYDRFRWQIYTT